MQRATVGEFGRRKDVESVLLAQRVVIPGDDDPIIVSGGPVDLPLLQEFKIECLLGDWNRIGFPLESPLRRAARTSLLPCSYIRRTYSWAFGRRLSVDCRLPLTTSVVGFRLDVL